MALYRIGILWFAFLLLAACSRSEQMETLYAQRCLGCHGTSGGGDGPIAVNLSVPVPDFRDTVEKKKVYQIRKIIKEGKGIMPAFGPALEKVEIQDMVRFVRILSQQGRKLDWWEQFEPLVWAHCSVPWEFVLGYDQRSDGDSP